MSISPQQAFDAVKVLDSRWVAIERSGPGLMRAMNESGLGVCSFSAPDLEWPDGVTQWPPPEPKWRVPTDEDAKSRPMCRVRDGDEMPWVDSRTCDFVLVAVAEKQSAFAIYNKSGFLFSVWKYCEIKAEVQS